MSSIPQGKIAAYHWILFAICFLGTAFAGVISTLMFVYLPVAVKDLLGVTTEDELNRISAYINSVFILGAAVGGILSGIFSDKAGRKAAVIASIGMYSFFTVLTGLMESWWTVVICRFFCGLGFGGIIVTGVTIMMEEWPVKTRSIFVGILSIAIPVGIFSAGVIDYFVSSWRQAFMAGLIPAVIAIASTWLLKESTNWKLAKERKDPGYIEPGVFAAEHRTDLLRGSLIFGTMLIGLWAVFSWLPTWVQSIVTDGDARQERGLAMMMMGMGGLTGGFLSGWLINAMGLRKSMLICFAVCAICALLLFKFNTSFSFLIYAEIALMAFSFGASQGVLSVYIPSLFPVSVRGTATGFCFNTGRVLTAAAVLFVGVLVTTLGGYGNSLLVFSSVFVAGFIVTYFSKQDEKSAESIIQESAPVVSPDV
jgi:MFS family permease